MSTESQNEGKPENEIAEVNAEETKEVEPTAEVAGVTAEKKEEMEPGNEVTEVATEEEEAVEPTAEVAEVTPEEAEEVEPGKEIPEIAAGDMVRVRIKLLEGERQQRQVFQGTVIRVRNAGIGSSFTVRRVTHGVGVERTFLMNSPLVEKIEVARRGKVRRAKLYYLRGLSAKASRIKEKT